MNTIDRLKSTRSGPSLSREQILGTRRKQPFAPEQPETLTSRSRHSKISEVRAA
jgi:hypothetical protein